MIDKGKRFSLTAVPPDCNNYVFYLKHLKLKTPPRNSHLAGM